MYYNYLRQVTNKVLICAPFSCISSVRFSYDMAQMDKVAKIRLYERQMFQKSQTTVNFLNIRAPKKFVVIPLKFELCGSTIE